MSDQLAALMNDVRTWIIGAVLGGIGWLVRRVLTNERQIALLEADLRNRDRQRSEDRETLAGVRDDLRRVRDQLTEILSSNR